ncbi:MAG: FtsX-like permease family protein [Acidobacteria bacterium]|nr:FtsX-like permease family protein [Acidobacteriota bacterium]
MNALACAWRSLVRQPARSGLGIIGVAAVGALLFDMLLLSEGLMISTRSMLDSMPFDIRVTSTDQMPGRGPDIADGPAAAAQIAALASVKAVTTLRREDAYLMRGDGTRAYGSVLGIGFGSGRPWTLVSGTDVVGDNEIVINEFAAQVTGTDIGASLTVRSNCADGATAPPAMEFRVTGIATFVFDALGEAGAGMTDTSLAEACGTPGAIPADFLMVQSTGDATSTAADIDALGLHLQASTNDEAMGQLQQREFTYFRQISTVLTTITISFALLLITVLLTVSVNQRLGEVAALRALGFSQGRVVLDVLWESVLIVGIGGILSLPLGALMAVWLDGILKRMPRIPADLHFFVFQPEAVWIHAALMAVTAFTAAIYPMVIVARLPIATTLRNEVVG